MNLAPLAVSLASDGSITITLLYSTALTTVTSNSCFISVPLAVAVIFALPVAFAQTLPSASMSKTFESLLDQTTS